MTSSNPQLSNRAIAALLFFCSTGYLIAWPHNLGQSDESYFLYHAKVVLEGGVPYRDFFEFYTPLANYFFVLLFAVFGVQIAAVKTAMALLHGTIVALLFLYARSLGVRIPLAVLGALAYLGLGAPTWPYASPHWMSTLMLLWILMTLLPRPLARGQLVILGSLVGVVLSMQQQIGAPVLVATWIVILVESRYDRRFGGVPSDSVPIKLLFVTGPAVAIPTLIMLAHVVAAGFEPVFEQIVLHPFTGYRRSNQSGWGEVHFMSSQRAAYTFPLILKYLPAVLIPTSAWRLVRAWRSFDRPKLERVSTLSIYSIAMALTVVNRPDFIHLAFIVAIYLLFCVETLEWGLKNLPVFERVAGWAGGIAIALSVAICVHLHHNYLRAWNNYRFPTETEFGRVDMATAMQVRVFDAVSAVLENEPERKLFCYPVYASLYLTTDAHNPTRHDIMYPGYLSRKEYLETIDILKRERVPYIVSFADPKIETDIMVQYLSQSYQCANGSEDCWLYRRIDR